MSNIQQVLEDLSNLDLSTVSIPEVRNRIESLGQIPCVYITFKAGRSIMRARPNEGKERFTSKCDLTYPPSQCVTEFQRANSPNHPVFYGSCIPEDGMELFLEKARGFTAYETMPWLRDETIKGYRKVTIGRWICKKGLKLLVILQHEFFRNASSYLKGIVDKFDAFCEEYPDKKEDIVAISDFFAAQFQKSDNYILSALFSERVIGKGVVDGILYPSVQVGVQGFNVAIKPEIVDQFLELVAVGECSVYKNYRDHWLRVDQIARLTTNQSHFEYLDSENPISEENILKSLGLQSMRDLV